MIQVLCFLFFQKAHAESNKAKYSIGYIYQVPPLGQKHGFSLSYQPQKSTSDYTLEYGLRIGSRPLNAMRTHMNMTYLGTNDDGQLIQYSFRGSVDILLKKLSGDKQISPLIGTGIQYSEFTYVDDDKVSGRSYSGIFLKPEIPVILGVEYNYPLEKNMLCSVRFQHSMAYRNDYENFYRENVTSKSIYHFPLLIFQFSYLN